MAEPVIELAGMLTEFACESLVHRYAQLADGNDPAAFAQLFTLEGVWGRPDGTRIKGRAQIQAAYARRPHAAGSRHHVLEVAIALHGTCDAVARSSAQVFKRAHDGQAASHLLKYVDRLRKSESGEWQIAERSSELLVSRPALEEGA